MSHNVNDPRHPWMRLNSAARTVRDTRDAATPYGFATRLAALAFAHERRIVSALERVSLRALGVACLLAIGSVAFNYPALMSNHGGGMTFNVDDIETAPVGDAVSVVLDLAD